MICVRGDTREMFAKNEWEKKKTIEISDQRMSGLGGSHKPHPLQCLPVRDKAH